MIVCELCDEIDGCVSHVSEIYIFTNGSKLVLQRPEEQFKFLIDQIQNLFQNSRLMPAFGVSLHEETQNALMEDEWIQLNFPKTLSVDGLEFDSLLFKIETTGGMNLIRLVNGKYEGRCFYLDFQEMLDLKQILKIS